MKHALCCGHRATRLAELWLDDAPGERRAALVEDGQIVEVHIQRDLHAALGEIGVGRIDRKAPSGAYLVCEDGREFLVRGKMALPEGASSAFEVMREAIAEPGRLKPAEARLIEQLPEAPTTREALWTKRIDMPLADTKKRVSISDAFDCAIAGASQVGDVLVSFQRTKAGLVFDVDGTGDAFGINLVAAKEVARLLRLYQVGGMAMIDFVSVDSKTKRQEIAEAFDAAAAVDGRPFERSAINGFGLMQVVRSRPRPSVLDQLFGTRIASLSDETQALWLLRDAARSSGFSTRTIKARPELLRLLELPTWGALKAQAERLCGAPVELVADDNWAGYGYVHVAQS